MSSPLKPRALAAICLLIASFVGHAQQSGPEDRPRSTVIVNAQVADGTGAPLRAVNVRIAADRIERVGSFKPRRNEHVVDAQGLVLAPGFIDIHNHSEEGLREHPLAETQIAQGITSVVLGADGRSPWPVRGWLDERRQNPAALNLALLVGHGTVRHQVMSASYQRAATPAEIDRMVQLVEQAMGEGAIGLSSGLEYEIASYSTTDEVMALARAAARRGGFYMTHVRDEADKSFEALHEEIAIGAAAGIAVQHSHIKLGTVGVWGKAPEFIRAIEAARSRGVDFLADCYPYDAWYSTIKVLVPDKHYEEPTSVARALSDAGGAGRVTIAKFTANRSYENRTIEELARAAGTTPVEMYIRIIREGAAAGADAYVIGQSMIESDIEAFYRQPWVMVSSDGGIGQAHPRSAGTFPRVLGRYVRDKQWLTLVDAVRKMTALPAQRLGWQDRGTIRAGAFADLVLFDPRTVTDHATFAQPTAPPTGIEAVFVNGTVVWREGKPTGARPGRVLTR